MFDKKVILISFSLFFGLLLAIFASVELVQLGYIPDDYVSGIIPILMISTAIIGWTLIGRYERSKVFRHHIEAELATYGYELISERPLTLGEILSTLDLKPAILINGAPLQSYGYISKNERILHVRTSQQEEFELRCTITKTWKRKYKLEILDTERK